MSVWTTHGLSMKRASAKKALSRPAKNPDNNALRLGDLDTRIRGMNIAAAAAREYFKHVGKARVWPAHIARLVDANLSLMGQRIMAQVRKAERKGAPEEAERIFAEGMREVGTASAKEYLSKSH